MKDGQRSEATRIALSKACLDVAAQFGVRGVTHRRVASSAGVSLGVTNYHYASIDEMLLEAFSHWVATQNARYESRLSAAADDDSMVDAIMGLITVLYEDSRDRILLYELYAQSVRDTKYYALVSEWSRRCRGTIEKHYSPQTARWLEAVWEGTLAQLVQGAAGGSVADVEPLIRLVLAQDRSTASTVGAESATVLRFSAR